MPPVRPCASATLIFVLPHSLIDRRNRPGIALSLEGAIVTLEVRIDRHQSAPRGSSAPYRVFAHDETGEIALTFFRAKGDWLLRQMPEGETMLVSGRMEWFNGRPSMVHPDHIVPIDKAADLPEIDPVYPLTAGLAPKILRRASARPFPASPICRNGRTRPSWPGTPSRPSPAPLARLNAPRDATDIALESPARRRLAYDEILAGQLALALVRARLKRAAGIPLARRRLHRKENPRRPALVAHRIPGAGPCRDQGGFGFTRPQCCACSGAMSVRARTVVALLAMARAAEAGRQSALMAPTEILARQHFFEPSRRSPRP